MKGLLVVIDGIDGSGKTTQVNLLAKFLEEQKIPYKVISFPRYEDNLYGKLIRRYLNGEFGGISEVDPYLISLSFAGDRLLAKPLIEKWLSEGKLVIANRYVSSSKAHLGANLPKEEREAFFRWLDNLEYELPSEDCNLIGYETNGIPREDLTILLKVDPKVGQKNVSGRHHDIHEENLRHLEEANKIYLSLAKRGNSWYVIDCMKNREMKEPRDIHLELVKKLENKI